MGNKKAAGKLASHLFSAGWTPSIHCVRDSEIDQPAQLRKGGQSGIAIFS